MTNRISVIQGNLSQKNANFAVLRSGTVITGRVLAKNSDGAYSVSLAGQKINVKSETPLQIGGIFSAKVSVKGETVSLSLVKENLQSGEILQKIGMHGELDPKIMNLLSSLGFEPNEASFKILQFMQQIGMKFDVSSAKKALASVKKDEKHTEKSQISLLLEEKGIKPNDERVQKILGKNQENENRKDKKQERKKLLPKTEENYARILSETVKSYFSQVDSASKSHKTGLLSAFNTVLSSGEKVPPLKHWLVLPFEWDFKNSYGNIKMLFDSELKNLEKVVIDLKNAEKNNIFVLYCKNGKVDSVKFSVSTALSDSEKSNLSEMLSASFGNKVAVSFAEYESLSGFCSDDEEFSFVRGEF